MKCRVAVTQFGTGTDVTENLATCLRMIDRAAECGPDFVVLPEFSNHCAIYQSLEYADSVALDLDGEFLAAIASKAKQHNTYVKINVTVRAPGDKPKVANLLYSPDGKLVGRSDKQTLMGNENNFCSRATEAGDIVETPFGPVGMYACADGLLMETTRLLAIRGARLLLNSLNSFAECEANLHIPVRAAENGVFVAASCKVDYLVPKEILAGFAEKMKIKPEALQGAGDSQIVAPDGTVLAKASRTGEDVAFADIDVSEASPNFAYRRPPAYQAIAEQPAERAYSPGASIVRAAVCEAVSDVSATGAKIIVLPELTDEVDSISALLSDNYAVTTIREGDAHVGVLLTKDGIIFRQKQMHTSQRYPWATDLADEISTFDLPFGRLAIIVGDDSNYPEVFRLAAYQNAEIAAVSFSVEEGWQTQFGLVERSAENRISVVVATKPNDAFGEYGRSMIATVSEDFTLWTEWKTRPFDGNINMPIVHRATGSVLEADIYPANSRNRFVSQQTDVVDGRAWWLLGDLVK